MSAPHRRHHGSTTAIPPHPHRSRRLHGSTVTAAAATPAHSLQPRLLHPRWHRYRGSSSTIPLPPTTVAAPSPRLHHLRSSAITPTVAPSSSPHVCSSAITAPGSTVAATSTAAPLPPPPLPPQQPRWHPHRGGGSNILIAPPRLWALLWPAPLQDGRGGEKLIEGNRRTQAMRYVFPFFVYCKWYSAAHDKNAENVSLES